MSKPSRSPRAHRSKPSHLAQCRLSSRLGGGRGRGRRQRQRFPTAATPVSTTRLGAWAAAAAYNLELELKLELELGLELEPELVLALVLLAGAGLGWSWLLAGGDQAAVHTTRAGRSPGRRRGSVRAPQWVAQQDTALPSISVGATEQQLTVAHSNRTHAAEKIIMMIESPHHSGMKGR